MCYNLGVVIIMFSQTYKVLKMLYKSYGTRNSYDLYSLQIAFQKRCSKIKIQQICDALEYLKAQGFVMFDDIHHSFFEITQEGLSIYESIRMERLEKVVVPFVSAMIGGLIALLFR